MARGNVLRNVAYLHPYKNALVIESHPAQLVRVPKAEGDACETAEETHDPSTPRHGCTVRPHESGESHAVWFRQAPQNGAIKSGVQMLDMNRAWCESANGELTLR